MSHRDAPTLNRITVTRHIPLSPEKIFDAWLDQANIGKWLFATHAGVMQRVELSPHEAGKFLITEIRGNILAEHHGTFISLQRPNQIVFDFSTDRESTPTRVTVSIDATASGSVVTLTHALDPQWASYADKARDGWTTILQGLEDTLLGGRTLVLARTIDAPRPYVFRAWTDPEILKRWFTPAPVITTECQIELKAGGLFRTVMQTPDGQLMASSGCILEVIPNQKLVFTDAFEAGFQPVAAPFLGFTAILTFADTLDGKTAYVARALHRTPEDRERHAAMGFHDGWSAATQQLETVARSLTKNQA
ncbi:MAG: SRPBCC domain-containing protein [Hyphomicrobiaceae bacterium]